ncbi:MAG: antitoxin MazE-like protein [Novosphingobium sp.]
MGVHAKMDGAQRVARRRAALRAQGLRPLQVWLPDLRDAGVRETIRADAAALSAQARTWAGVVDDAEAMIADVLDRLPLYDWSDPEPAGR